MKSALQKGDIKFSINKIITSWNSSDVRYINLSIELKNIHKDNFQSKSKQLSSINTTGGRPSHKNGTGDRNEREKRQSTERG